jgi:hypothetical protein
MRRSQFSFVRKNIEESPNHFRTIDYDNKKLELSEKIMNALEKKADIDLERRKMNIINIHKWQLVKEKREEMERICNNIRLVKSRKSTYAKGILTFHLICKIWKNFRDRRSAVLLEMKINFAVFQFGLGLKRYLKKKGPNRE